MSGKMESAAPRNVENGFSRPAGSEFPPTAPDYAVPVHTPPQGGMAGLQSLCAACQRLYPEQPNPLQVTARLKYWLGGPDPLDYISMYWNPGQPDLRVPPHWHYISFGLSDLHGDGRVHPRPAGPPSPDRPSGLGIELTMRVVGEEGGAPTWPAALLQRLARYIFTTGNCLCVGDHVSWHSPLDGGPAGAIRHMLVGADPRLSTTHTPLGKVDYVQVVGVTDSELRSAQRCGGTPLLEALADLESCGPWLVTDMQRVQSAELPADPQGPSDLSGVAASCRWEPLPPVAPPAPERDSSEIPQTVKEEIKCVLQRGLSDIISKSTSREDAPVDECKMSTDSTKLCESSKKLHVNDSTAKSLAADKDISMSTDSFKMTDMENALLEEVMQLPPKGVVAEEGDLSRVHLFFDKEAASLLPLALRGRVVHGAHFTWTAVGGVQAITLLGPGVGGALASATKPIAALNGWLQVFIPCPLALEMAEQLAGLEGAAVEGEVASHYEWPHHGLAITVLDIFS